MAIELLEIPERDGLDSIRVYFDNRGLGQGYLTITCYGCAWNSWWGAMGGDTLQQFFAGADNGYLAGRLGIREHLKQRDRDHKYLWRLIDAIKAELALTVTQ